MFVDGVAPSISCQFLYVRLRSVRVYETGLLAVIEVLVVVFGGWSGFEGNGDWTKVPSK